MTQDVKIENLSVPQKLIDNPYETVSQFYEQRYPNAGYEVFRYAGLVPNSALLPPITKKSGQTTDTNVHVFLLANSSGGKTQLMKEVKKLSYNPWHVSRVTSSKFEEKVSRNSTLTLLVNDLRRSMQESNGFAKAYESAVDGRIANETKHGSSIAEDVQMSSIAGGVRSDLTTKKFYSGVLQRMAPVFIMYDIDQQKEIGRRIAESFYDDSTRHVDNVTQEDIVLYYELLQKIQRNMKTDFQRVTDFGLTKDASEFITEQYESAVEEYADRSTYYFRDLEYAFSYAANLAFLNYFNRDITDGVLRVEREDAEQASRLMRRQIAWKAEVLNDEKARQALEQMTDIEPDGTI